MEITLGIVVVILIGVVIYLATRPPKIQTIEKVVERVIQVDLEAEQKAKFEELYRIKQKELDEQISEQQKQKLSELNEYQKQKFSEIDQEIEQRKQKLVDDLSKEVYLYESEKESKIFGIEDAFQEFKNKIKFQANELNFEIKKIMQQIEEWKSKHHAVIETYKNLDKIKQEDDFHRVVLSDFELDELSELNNAIKKLRNPMPFYKAVYDIYYKNKINDLAIRITGKNRVSGIYKITHIESGKVYIGQSVDIGERWKQHCKRGCGADTLTNNKLYSAMMQFGIHSFSFEIVETTTDTSKLSELEKYWQEFFQAKEFGYSMK